jgi:aspartate kinase
MTRVLKFGGSSLADADCLRAVAAIVGEALPAAPVVVLSASGDTTDDLFSAAHAARGGDIEKALGEVGAVLARHAERARGLFGEDRPAELERALAAHAEELEGLLRGVALLRELSPRSMDAIAAHGERLSTRLFASLLAREERVVTWFDAREVVVTDERFGQAQPDRKRLGERARERLAPLVRPGACVVTQGYVGATPDGVTTTLGRGGSDFTAALLGAALGADEVQIWTDVEGVMSADPRVVPDALPILALSFAEAAELAFFGAKVLHPATMAPAVAKDIPIRVLNSFRPEQPGTSVVARPEADAGKAGERSSPVRSIAHKDHIAVVNVVAAPMMLQFGFLEKVAEVFARHEIVVDMIATTELSLALSTEPGARLEPAVAELSTFAEASIVRDLSLVSVVGEGLREKIDPCATVLATLAELGVRVEMISYGATRNNLSVVIPGGRVREVVAALHGRLFEG